MSALLAMKGKEGLEHVRASGEKCGYLTNEGIVFKINFAEISSIWIIVAFMSKVKRLCECDLMMKEQQEPCEQT